MFDVSNFYFILFNLIIIYSFLLIS